MNNILAFCFGFTVVCFGISCLLFAISSLKGGK